MRWLHVAAGLHTNNVSLLHNVRRDVPNNDVVPLVTCQIWCRQRGSLWAKACPSTCTCSTEAPALDSWLEHLGSLHIKHWFPVMVGARCLTRSLNYWRHSVGPPQHRPLIINRSFSDYDAPLSEAGEYTPKYHILRDLLSRFTSMGISFT